jgi:hypothetical protein
MPRGKREVIDLHVITQRGSHLVAQVIDGRVIVPPAPRKQQLDRIGKLPVAAPAQLAPGK